MSDKFNLRTEFSGLSMIVLNQHHGEAILSAGTTGCHRPRLYVPADAINQPLTERDAEHFGLEVIPGPGGRFHIEFRLEGAFVEFADSVGAPLAGPVEPHGGSAEEKQAARTSALEPSDGLAFGIDVADIISAGPVDLQQAANRDGKVRLPGGVLRTLVPKSSRDRGRIYEVKRSGGTLFRQPLCSMLILDTMLDADEFQLTMTHGGHPLRLTIDAKQDVTLLMSAQCSAGTSVAADNSGDPELQEFNASLSRPAIDVTVDYGDKATIPHRICPAVYWKRG